jgi:hypothetical protein
MNTKFLTVGSDPESFLRNSKGELVSAIGLIPGTKSSPFKTTNGSIQHDNILAEFNSRPSNTLLEFINNHRLIIGDLNSILNPLDLKLDFIASAMCSDELLSDPIAKVAGCDPDYNAWLLCRNNPVSYTYTSLRAAGGHVHIAFDQSVNNPKARIDFVRALDMVLGVPSVVVDNDNARRTVYGKAGSFRPKDTINFNDDIGPDPYDGVEYRTLSNFWLRSESLMEFVWNGVERVYNNLEELSERAEFYKDAIIDIINTGNSAKADLFCRVEGIYAPGTI